MRDFEERRSGDGRRVAARVGAGVLTAVLVAACAGENLFPAFIVTAPEDLLGPQVDITAPSGPVTVPPGGTVSVTAALSSGEGLTQVAFTGTLEAGGAAFTPVTLALASPRDTTVTQVLTRSTATTGTARIIVTATDVTGDQGADTVSVTLGT